VLVTFIFAIANATPIEAVGDGSTVRYSRAGSEIIHEAEVESPLNATVIELEQDDPMLEELNLDALQIEQKEYNSPFDVVVPNNLDDMEAILMRYNGSDWDELNIMVEGIHLPPTHKSFKRESNVGIFLRIVTKLLVDSETILGSTPSHMNY
jgi:hypothetical protein